MLSAAAALVDAALGVVFCTFFRKNILLTMIKKGEKTESFWFRWQRVRDCMICCNDHCDDDIIRLCCGCGMATITLRWLTDTLTFFTIFFLLFCYIAPNIFHSFHYYTQLIIIFKSFVPAEMFQEVLQISLMMFFIFYCLAWWVQLVFTIF